jgi:hypothetical protein
MFLSVFVDTILLRTFLSNLFLLWLVPFVDAILKWLLSCHFFQIQWKYEQSHSFCTPSAVRFQFFL